MNTKAGVKAGAVRKLTKRQAEFIRLLQGGHVFIGDGWKRRVILGGKTNKENQVFNAAIYFKLVAFGYVELGGELTDKGKRY